MTGEVGFRHLTAVGAFTDVNLAQSTLQGIVQYGEVVISYLKRRSEELPL